MFPIRAGRNARSRASCASGRERRRGRRSPTFLGDHVAKWQVPERWSFIDEVPKTSVGKFDKKVLRARHENGDLAVETLE